LRVAGGVGAAGGKVAEVRVAAHGCAERRPECGVVKTIRIARARAEFKPRLGHRQASAASRLRRKSMRRGAPARSMFQWEQGSAASPPMSACCRSRNSKSRAAARIGEQP
jgi:hypothetical protein